MLNFLWVLDNWQYNWNINGLPSNYANEQMSWRKQPVYMYNELQNTTFSEKVTYWPLVTIGGEMACHHDVDRSPPDHISTTFIAHFCSVVVRTIRETLHVGPWVITVHVYCVDSN